MLETLRQYARERLDESGEPDAWRRRHAEYYERLADDVGARLVGPDELVVRRQLHEDLDNLRAAVLWALDRDDRDDVEIGIGIVAALAVEAWSSQATGMGTWAEAALQHVADTTPARRFDVRVAAAWGTGRRPRRPRGRGRARREAVAGGIPIGAGTASMAHTTIAMTLQIAGNNDEAHRVLDDGLRALEAARPRPFDRGRFCGAARPCSRPWDPSTRPAKKAEAALVIRATHATRPR